ncbi:MAG: translocation/assembly module TamB domain-containing protein [Erythrobacter sp.]|nr:translocation/assembly module TamB domain-containing protein [Erythrobacter sp.]
MAEEADMDIAPPEDRRSWPKRIARWLGIALAVLAGLVALALIGINTPPGKDWVKRQIEGLEFENGLEIGIGKLEGSLYGNLVIRDLALSDPEGVFASAERVTLDWRPFAFIGNTLDIRSLSSPELRLERLPEFAETPPDDAPLLPGFDIDIDRLVIDRIVVGEAVTGTQRVLTLKGEAHVEEGRAQVMADLATLPVEESPGEAMAGDRLALVLDAVPEENRLALEFDLAAPRDGVIAALAGLSQPLTAELTGEGDWAAWNGRLSADLAGEALARLDLAARDGTFGIEGTAEAARLFEGSPASLLAPQLAIDMTADIDGSAAELAGTLSSGAFRLEAEGGVDISASTFEELAVDFRLTEPSALTDAFSGRGIAADIVLDGAFATPAIDYRVTAERLGIAGVTFVDLSAAGVSQREDGVLTIPVEARAARVTGIDTAAGGPLTNLRLTGSFALEGDRLLADNLRLTSRRIDARGTVLANLAAGRYSGSIDGTLDNYRIESVGIFDIGTDIELAFGSEGDFSVRGRVRTRSQRILNEGVRDFLGGQAVAASDIVYTSDGRVRFTNLRIRAPQLQVTGGSGFYTLDGRLALDASGTSEAYGPFTLAASGTLADPNAVLTAERPGLGVGLANLTAEIEGAPGGYRLVATGDTDYGPIDGDFVLGTGETLTLDITRADFAGIGLSGSLEQSAAGPFVGRLDADGRGIEGIVRLDAQGEYQEALVNLRAQDSNLGGPLDLSIGAARVDARIVLYDSPRVIGEADVARANFGPVNINAAKARIDYRDGTGSARILAEGTSGAPFRIAANAQLRPDLWRAALKGKVRGIAFRTASPARIVPGEGTYELLPTRIEVGSGSLRLAGLYGEGLRLQSRIDDLDVALVNAFVPGLGLAGSASGSLDFAQASPDAFPRADARLRIDRFSRSTAAAVSEPIDINFVGKLLADGGEARAVARRRGAVIGRMVASLSPLGPGAGPWTERLLEAPLGGGVRYNGPAATLFSFAGQPNQTLEGTIGVAADFNGRVDNPQLSGLVRAQSLTYSNQLYGTRLSDMAVSARFDGSRLEVERLTANAGNGTVSVDGFVSLASESGYPMDLQADLRNARLARSDAVSARATGELRLTKAAGETALLAGEIRLGETRYQIVRQSAAEVPELEGVRFKEDKGPVRITGDEPTTTGPGLFGKVRLDVALRAPDELYVSGMGLESEWSADLSLAGTSADPRVSGTISLIRGTLGFAGRSFDLTDGRLGFVGGQETNPTIELAATERIDDINVNVNVAGRAFDPQITFGSTPSLPQDEVLSRILFGSSIANLSAFQAVQLAASLNSLRSTGGGFNPLGTLRSATGLDRLRVLGSDEATGRGTAVAAGQYITDDIYVEFITDARGFTATQIEISLTRTLSVLSQAGGSGATNVNVQYSKDY